VPSRDDAMMAARLAMEGLMSEKPSYLGLLNAIAVAETQAHEYLTAWIAVTDNPDVRKVLSTVAAREGEHGMTFAKRVDELGYSVRWKQDPGHDTRMSIACSERTDLEKMEKLGLGRPESEGGSDFFDSVFADHSIDIATGALLGRYITDERDSARLLRGCYEALKANEEPGTSNGGHGSSGEGRLGALEAKLDAVCDALERLQVSISSTADDAGMANGRSAPPRPRSRTRA
jgi:rubrerythrin